MSYYFNILSDEVMDTILGHCVLVVSHQIWFGVEVFEYDGSFGSLTKEKISVKGEG